MKNESMPVLSVKYKIPPPRKHYIVRKSLMDDLKSMQNKKMTIVKAGAGSGKTTLLSVYIREQKVSDVQWITLDDSMNQVFLFWRYILEALDHYITNSIESLRSCFDGNIQKEMLEQMIQVLAAKISTEKEIFLILDDFQWIQDKYLLKTIDIFIKLMPEQLHLVILSREMPGIYLGSLYMEDELLLIDEEQMRLTSDECYRFLTDTLALSLEREQIQDIVENANGWIGGAQLMAVAGKTGMDRSAVYVNADSQVIYEYIEREIFDALSGEEQLFLIKTGILSYFNEEICARYLPEYNFSHMMQMILEKNLFVVNIDEEKQEYRYHAILRECLLHMMEKNCKEKEKLEKKAATIFFDLKDYDESVRLMSEGKDYEMLMERLLLMPQNVVTFSYMMQIPLPQIVKNTNFAYQYFFCYYAALESGECEQIYNYITENMKEDETFQAFRHANLFFNINWEFQNIKIMSLEQIESMPLNKVTRAYLLIKEAYFLFLADHIPEAIEFLRKAETIYKDTDNIYIKCFALAEETQIWEQYGELGKALKLYGELEGIVKEVKALRTSYHIGIAGVYIKQLRIEEAKKELDYAAEFMLPGVESVSSAYLYTLAEWYYIAGHPEKTEEIILSLKKNEIYQSVFFSARLLRYPVYRGKNEELAKLFLKNYESADDLMKNMDTELLYTGIVFELIEKERAIRLLETLTANARKRGNKLKIIEGTLMMVRFLWEMGEHGKRIQNLLLEAVAYGEQEYAAQPFWFEKESLLKIMAEKGPEFRNLLSDREQQFLGYALQTVNNGAERMAVNLVEALTAREMEVIEEMAKGESNKEIARNLCISLATVKTHLINIYGKLGVSNRMSAVNKMKTMGFLKEKKQER